MPFFRARYGSRIDIPLDMPVEEAFAEACQHLDIRPLYKARYLYYRIGSIRAIYTDHPVFRGEDQELFLHTSPSRLAISWKVVSPILYCVILAAFVLHYIQQEGTIPLYLSSTAGTLGTLCAMSLMFIPWHEAGILLRREKIYGRHELRSYSHPESPSMKLPKDSLA